MLLQLPAPPTPPPPPVAILTSFGPTHDLIIGVTMIVLVIVGGLVLFPLVRALARRLEGRGTAGTDPMVLDRVAELEHRLGEAEERIDFNERMLSQREPVALPRDKAD